MRPGVSRRHADAPELAEAVGRLARASLLVVGDAMLDRYVYGQLKPCARDGLFPVLEVEREVALPGGAANLVRQLTGLGASVSFVSVVGDDQTGSDLTGLIGGQPGVEPWLLVEGGRTTTQRTRFLAQGQPVLRADQTELGPIPPKLGERLLRFARDAMLATAVAVLFDHGNGVLSAEMPTQLLAAARQIGRPIVAVPRGADFSRYAGADVVVVSPRQPGQEGADDDRSAASASVAGDLRERHGFGAVMVIRDSGTLILADAEGVYESPADPARPMDGPLSVYPVVAALAAGLAGGLELRVAARRGAVADSDLLQALAI
jgi:D-beta-D-heptose 7-phosphate kinase/D-beta-D-heptose 1-phosphate adenosyltransferase